MKTTSTIEDILRGEAKANGWDDIFNSKEYQLIRYGDESALIYQVATYTPFMSKLCDHLIFGQYKLESFGADQFFKKAFMNRFINREIAQQTIDIFRNHVVQYLATNDEWLSETYDHFDDMFSNKSDNSNKGQQNYKDKTRTAEKDLPQNNTDLDLNQDIYDYSTKTDQTNFKHDATDNRDIVAHSFSPDVIAKLDNIYKRKLDECDKKLFLQMW